METRIYNSRIKEFQSIDELCEWYAKQDDLSFSGFYDNGYSYCCSLKTENTDVIRKEYDVAIKFMKENDLKKNWHTTMNDYLNVYNHGDGMRIEVSFTQTSTYKKYSQVSNT